MFITRAVFGEEIPKDDERFQFLYEEYDFISDVKFVIDCLNDFDMDSDEVVFDLEFEEYNFINLRYWDVDEMIQADNNGYFSEYIAYLDHVGVADYSRFIDAFMGHYDNEEEFSETIFTDVWETPERFLNYIDWSLVWRDLRHDYFCIDTMFFRNL